MTDRQVTLPPRRCSCPDGPGPNHLVGEDGCSRTVDTESNDSRPEDDRAGSLYHAIADDRERVAREVTLPPNGVLIYDGNGWASSEDVCRGNRSAVIAVRNAVGTVGDELHVKRSVDGMHVTVQVRGTAMTYTRGALVAVLKHVLGEPVR